METEILDQLSLFAGLHAEQDLLNFDYQGSEQFSLNSASSSSLSPSSDSALSSPTPALLLKSEPLPFHQQQCHFQLVNVPLASKPDSVRRLSIDSSSALEQVDSRTRRLIKNRESASLSRQRKKKYVQQLEEQVARYEAEVKRLRQTQMDRDMHIQMLREYMFRERNACATMAPELALILRLLADS